MREFIFGFMILVSMIYFTGCGSGVQTINIDLSSDANANGGNAVVIKIYQLKTDNKFRYAQYESLLKNAEETLANDLIPPIKEETMTPSEKYPLKEFKLSKDAAFLGVVGDFHTPAKDSWKKIIPLDSDIEYLKIFIHENSLTIETE